jgi:protein-S-isoprenylcysteine O-methyltransferase Ste14
VAPLPFSQPAARIPFDIVLGIWVLGEWRVRLRSHLNRRVLALVPAAGLVVRIRFEERALLEGLGEPYRRFAASRPRLFPGLW